MKKELFKRQLAIIMAYMPDRQMIKILGQNDRYQIDPETGIITDMMSAQENPETGEVTYTRQANIRDVRSLEYNVIAEQAAGNLSKRMTELQVLLEMGEKLPVPPEQIISKLEISATEKERWIQYIKQQEQAGQEKQEKLEALEIQFKDREIKIDEQRNKQDFIISMGKINQAAEKDEKSMAAKFAQMEADEKANALQFAQQIMQAAIDEQKAKQQMSLDAIKAGQDLIQDSSVHTQDMYQDDSKHNQDMRFIEEKNAIVLEAARKKAEQDIEIAKEKAAQQKAMAAQKAKEGGKKDVSKSK